MSLHARHHLQVHLQQAIGGLQPRPVCHRAICLSTCAQHEVSWTNGACERADPETDLKCARYSACCWGVPRRTSEAGVMAADSPVPRWSISSTRKWLTAALIQADASAGRGPSCPGPPVQRRQDLLTRTDL